MTTRDCWNPDQYERFRDERSAPFYDLLAMVEPRPGMRSIDLGCGTGELTAQLHKRLRCASMLGVDNSPAMLDKARSNSVESLIFTEGDIGTWSDINQYDLLFSNAALQWVDDHESLFPRLVRMVANGGQLAIQMPANHDHPSHVIAAAVAAEEPFRSLLKGYVRHSPVREPEWYAATLYKLGFRRQLVRLQVYPHLLDDREGVIEWVKGTLLTDYAKRLSADDYVRFLVAFRERLFTVLPDDRPYFYPFKRLLIWGG